MHWNWISNLLTLLLCIFAECLDLPPIHWNSSNAMFKTSNNDHIIEVHMWDSIDFICPYMKDLHQDPYLGSDYTIMKEPEYYVIYQVTEMEYENCNIFTESRKRPVRIVCDKAWRKKYYTIIFQPYSAIPNSPEFIPGETYYYITTSTGQLDGLSNVHQGACHYNNMKLKVKVCCSTTTSSSTLNPMPGTKSSHSPTERIHVPTSSDKHLPSSTSEPKWKEQLHKVVQGLLPDMDAHDKVLKDIDRDDLYSNSVLPKHEEFSYNTAAYYRLSHTVLATCLLLLFTLFISR